MCVLITVEGDVLMLGRYFSEAIIVSMVEFLLILRSNKEDPGTMGRAIKKTPETMFIMRLPFLS